MFQLVASYLAVTDSVSSFSFLTQTCQKTYPVVVENMLFCFKRAKNIQASKNKQTNKHINKQTNK